MTAVEADPLVSLLAALEDAAEDFAARARMQEALRDRARPGTSAQHLHAHSATLWRTAEGVLRARVAELVASVVSAPG